MTILVTGSTGAVGSAVLASLHARGAASVRALTRSPERARLPPGVTAVQGDLTDVDAMRAALAGVSTLFLLVPNAADELTQAISTLNVARDAQVKGIVYLSVFMGEAYADVPHFTSKFTVERMIEQCDLPATVLRPAYFMQNDARQKDALLKSGIYGMPVGAKGISMVDTGDIGDAAAIELMRREASREPLGRETYALAGPDALGGDDLAGIWSAVLSRAIAHGCDDLDRFEQGMKAVAPAWIAYDMRRMFQRYQEDGAVAGAEDLRRLTALLGRSPRTYRAFADETAAQWAAG